MINYKDETYVKSIIKGLDEIARIFDKFYDIFRNKEEMNIKIYSLLHDIKKAILQIKIK